MMPPLTEPINIYVDGRLYAFDFEDVAVAFINTIRGYYPWAEIELEI